MTVRELPQKIDLLQDFHDDMARAATRVERWARHLDELPLAKIEHDEQMATLVVFTVIAVALEIGFAPWIER